MTRPGDNPGSPHPDAPPLPAPGRLLALVGFGLLFGSASGVILLMAVMAR